MAEADDVGAVLPESGGEGEPLGVVDQRDEPGLAVAVIAHQDGQLAAGFQGAGAVADELAVAPEEMLERRRSRQVAGIVGVELLPPVGGCAQMKSNVSAAEKSFGSQASKPWWMSQEHAGDAEFLADVARSAGAGHRVEDQAGPEIESAGP